MAGVTSTSSLPPAQRSTSRRRCRDGSGLFSRRVTAMHRWCARSSPMAGESTQRSMAHPGCCPHPPTDNAVRFDAALAAARFGRGCHLIGLHLTLGVIREALVHRMVAADRAVGTTHHRSETRYDADTPLALEALAEPLGPQTALDAYELYGAWRSATEAGYTADPVGLQAVIDRGRCGSPPASRPP